MRSLILIALAASLVAGCSPRADRILFDGQYFRTKASKDKEDPRNFTVSVPNVSASLAGAREAGRYEAIKYCVTQYGTSVIDWTQGPDAPDEALSIDRDTMTLVGTCKP